MNIYFDIQIGQAPRIRNINFEGNTAFPDAVLLDLMETQPRSRVCSPRIWMAILQRYL